MTADLEARRLLKTYQDLAAAGYPGGPQGFSRLADMAEVLVINVSHEAWMPATVVLNAFQNLSEDSERWARAPESGPAVPPELHAAILTTLKFLVHGGDASLCLELSELLIRVYPHASDREPEWG